MVPNYFVVGIDLSRGLEFLDKDLERIMPEADTKRRHADKLSKPGLRMGRSSGFWYMWKYKAIRMISSLTGCSNITIASLIVTISQSLLSCGLSKAKIRRLYNFINMYVSFQNLENKLKFEEEVRKITKSRAPMGLEEAILKEVREQGIEQNQRAVTIRSYEKGMSVTDIADITGLTVEEVEQIIAAYKAPK